MEEKYTLKIIFDELRRFGGEFNQRLDEVNKRLDGMEGRLDNIEENIDMRFVEVNRRLDTFEADLKEIKRAITVVEAKTKGYDRKFEAIGREALA